MDANGRMPEDMTSIWATVWQKNWASEVEYVPVEAANRVEYLTSAKVDIILANFTVTDERKEQVELRPSLHESIPRYRVS